MCFVDLEKAFDKAPRKVVEWVIQKRYCRRIVYSCDDTYKDTMAKVKVGIHLSEELKVNVRVHQ